MQVKKMGCMLLCVKDTPLLAWTLTDETTQGHKDVTHATNPGPAIRAGLHSEY